MSDVIPSPRPFPEKLLNRFGRSPRSSELLGPEIADVGPYSVYAEQLEILLNNVWLLVRPTMHSGAEVIHDYFFRGCDFVGPEQTALQ
jgi:hypothetical protein